MKIQLKFQKAVVLFMLIAFALAFAFSVSISTDVYDMLYNFANPTDPSKDRVPGASYYYTLQPFNKQLVRTVLMGLLTCVLLFVTHTSVRRKYYLTNYIATGIVSASGIGIALWAIPSILYYKELYLTTVDFERLQFWTELIPSMTYTESTFWFDICAVAYVVLAVASVALIGNAIWKFLLLQRENRLLNGSASKAELNKEGN